MVAKVSAALCGLVTKADGSLATASRPDVSNSAEAVDCSQRAPVHPTAQRHVNAVASVHRP